MGLPALTPHPALALAAQEHSAGMARNDLLSRSVAGGSTVEQRVARAGLHLPLALVEAIAGGQATPEEVVGAWMAAPSTRRQILDPAVSLAGVGYAYSGDAAYRHYWTLDLAGRQEAQAHLVSPLPVGRLPWLRDCLPGLVRRFGLARVG